MNAWLLIYFCIFLVYSLYTKMSWLDMSFGGVAHAFIDVIRVKGKHFELKLRNRIYKINNIR
jgi:hypothetical protein